MHKIQFVDWDFYSWNSADVDLNGDRLDHFLTTVKQETN